MPDREEDKARLRRKASQEAISLAMQSRWQEAVTVNQSIIELLPTDIDAYNRLGRAFMELGEFARAKESYTRALGLDPYNSIAQKNLQRLSLLPDLKVKGQQLVVENDQGEHLGLVEPPHGFRLARMIEGGNKYTAALVSINNDSARVIIREVFQHPSQAGRLSFPVKAVEGFQPHVRDTLLRHEAVEEEALEEAEDMDLEEGELIPEGFSIFEGVAPDEETETEEEFTEE